MDNITSASQAVKPTARDKYATKKIKTEIILGSPSSGCQGVGICRVMPYGQPNPYKCTSVTSWISKTPDGKIQISFLKSAMEPRYMRRHFGWMLFQVCEPAELPRSIIKSLTSERVIVQPGIYTVWESAKHLIVEF